MKSTIRRAGLADSESVAGIHVRGWQWGYRGLLPDEFLDGLSVAVREGIWRERLAAESPNRTWIAEVDNDAVAFVSYGPAVDEALAAETGQIFALYQERHAAGTGLGRALLAHAMRDLINLGFRAAVLWVLEGNLIARRFYEVAGWSADGVRMQEVRNNQVLHKVRYRILLA